MYRPDYDAPSRRGVRWAPLLTFGLFIGLFGAGLFNGWWSELLAHGADRPADTSAAMLPTPIDGMSPPRLLEPLSRSLESTSSGNAALNSATPARSETVALGKPAPNFVLPDLFTEQTDYVLSTYRGRPVILNFWASWCLPCRREMPALQATAARYAEDGLLLLGMNQTYIDDLDAARDFVGELGLTFPNTRDDRGAVGADAYQVVGIPTSVFIDATGEVVHIQIGEMSLEQITTYTERLIAGQPLQP